MDVGSCVECRENPCRCGNDYKGIPKEQVVDIIGAILRTHKDSNYILEKIKEINPVIKDIKEDRYIIDVIRIYVSRETKNISYNGSVITKTTVVSDKEPHTYFTVPEKNIRYNTC